MINPINLYNLLMHGTIQSYYHQIDSFSFHSKATSNMAPSKAAGEALLIVLHTDPVTPADYIYLQVTFSEDTTQNEAYGFKTMGEAQAYFQKRKNAFAVADRPPVGDRGSEKRRMPADN